MPLTFLAVEPSDESFPDYDLRFEERPGYLLAHVTGPADSLDVSLSYWQEIVEEVTRLQVTRLLVVEDFPNDVSTLEMLRVVNYLVSLGLRHIHTAFVDVRHDQLARNLLGELVVVAHGLPAKVFASVEQGERWLLAQ